MAADASPDGQMGKWGFVPGAEDTMDLNLEDKGQSSNTQTAFIGVAHPGSEQGGSTWGGGGGTQGVSS